MRIAVVTDSVYPYNKGGKEKRIYDIMTRLAKLGHHIDVYTMKWWDGPVDREDAGMHLHGVVPLKKLYVSAGRRSIAQAIHFGFGIFLPLLRAKFDVLEVDHMPFFQLFSCKLVALMKRKKLAASWNEVWGRAYWNEYLPKFGVFGYLIEKLSVHVPDVIISISAFTTRRLTSMLGVPERRIETIPCGVDVENIRKGTEEKTCDVLYYGRLLRHKNVDRLVRAMKLVVARRPDASCVIIGDGPEREALVREAERAGVTRNVVFKDFLPSQEELYRQLQQTRLFVSPATREGFGIAVLEASAAGLPVIIIDHPENAAKDFVTDGVQGFVCALDEHEIANRIEAVLADDGLRKRMGAAGVENARQYDPDVVARTVAAVYERLQPVRQAA